MATELIGVALVDKTVNLPTPAARSKFQVAVCHRCPSPEIRCKKPGVVTNDDRQFEQKMIQKRQIW